MATKTKNADTVPVQEVPWKIIHIVEQLVKNEGIRITETEALQMPHGCLLKVHEEYWDKSNFLTTCNTVLQYLPGTRIEEKEGRAILVVL